MVTGDCGPLPSFKEKLAEEGNKEEEEDKIDPVANQYNDHKVQNGTETKPYIASHFQSVYENSAKKGGERDPDSPSPSFILQEMTSLPVPKLLSPFNDNLQEDMVTGDCGPLPAVEEQSAMLADVQIGKSQKQIGISVRAAAGVLPKEDRGASNVAPSSSNSMKRKKLDGDLQIGKSPKQIGISVRAAAGVLPKEDRGASNVAPSSSKTMKRKKIDGDDVKHLKIKRVKLGALQSITNTEKKRKRGEGPNESEFGRDESFKVQKIDRNYVPFHHDHKVHIGTKTKSHVSSHFQSVYVNSAKESGERNTDSPTIILQSHIDVLKEARKLKDTADRLKSSGVDCEFSDVYFQAALQFLHGAWLLEIYSSDGGSDIDGAIEQTYITAANLYELCGHEFERHENLAAAALAYKCKEIAYMRVVSLNASRDRNEIVKLLEYVQCVDCAMEALAKSRNTFAAVKKVAKNKECITCIKTAMDFSFQNVEEFVRLVRLARKAIYCCAKD